VKTADDIKARIDSLCTLFGFEYNGKVGNVDPYSHTEFLLYFDGAEQTVTSIEDVMNTPFIDGFTLSELADQITITDW
jgi:hypothetical protein